MDTPIDLFLASLANDRRQDAIGVLLSILSADGLFGLQTIRAAGGITMIAEEAWRELSARSLPLAGLVNRSSADLILPARALVDELGRIVQALPPLAPTATPAASSLAEIPAGAQQPPGETEPFQQILALIRSATGVDLTHWNRTILEGRISRRLLVRRIQDLAEYAEFLRGHSREAQQFLDDVTLPVGQLFREPQLHHHLSQRVLPRLARTRASQPTFRAWVPHCATGVDAYSIAITLYDSLIRLWQHPSIQVFATDANRHALERAREGIFSPGVMHEVPPRWLHRHFVATNGVYQVHDSIRSLCAFDQHVLTTDPPLVHLDLVDGRRAMADLAPAVHRQILSRLYQAIKPDGVLVLSPSQPVEGLEEWFVPAEGQPGIYTKRPAAMPDQHPPTGEAPPPADRAEGLVPAQRRQFLEQLSGVRKELRSAHRELAAVRDEQRRHEDQTNVIAADVRNLLARVTFPLPPRQGFQQNLEEQAREALHESEERLRAILSSLHETFIIVHDRQGLPTSAWVTPELEQRYGLRANDLLTHKPGELLTGPCPLDQSGLIPHVFQTGEPVRQDCQVDLPGGRFWFDVAFSPMRAGPQHAISAVVGVFRDITNRKHAEEELLRAHAQLATAREEQRRQFARDLHDSVGQELIAMKLSLESILAGSEAELRPDVAGLLRETMDKCVTLIRDVRDISHGLYPPTLEALGLIAALKRLVHDAELQMSASLEYLPHLESVRFASQVELALFRIAQEAVHNAMRHSHATQLRIQLRQPPDTLEMIIEDDGVGFDPSVIPGKGMGLSSIRERVATLGGELQIHSQPNHTAVILRIPMPAVTNQDILQP